MLAIGLPESVLERVARERRESVKVILVLILKKKCGCLRRDLNKAWSRVMVQRKDEDHSVSFLVIMRSQSSSL